MDENFAEIIVPSFHNFSELGAQYAPHTYCSDQVVEQSAILKKVKTNKEIV